MGLVLGLEIKRHKPEEIVVKARQFAVLAAG